jgi:hypothetical protein
MALPTRDQLHDEVDRVFRELFPTAPERLDPDDPNQSDLVAAWLEQRDITVNEWTNAVFFEFFPDAGKLDPDNPGDAELIEYWLDIRDQIRDDAPPKYDWSGSSVVDSSVDTAAEVEMDFEPDEVGPGIREVPTDADASAGRELLKRLLFEDAHADAQLFAAAYEQWELDWEPNEAFGDTAKDLAEGFFTAKPTTLVKGAAKWLAGILIESEYAQYKGRIRAFCSIFYGAVATGATAGLLDGQFPEREDEFLTAAAAGAWERTESLPREDKQKIIAAAIAANDTLPNQLDEYLRRVWETGEVYSGVLALLESWDDIL